MPLKAAQKKTLRGLAHHLKPVVTVADKGLSVTVVAELERALNDHELIKVKLRSERDKRKEWAQKISELCGAELVHTIGQVACFYKRHPDKPIVDPGK